MASTSSFSEGSSVFGGSSNLVSAIETIFTVYEPDVVAVHTTCLSETIGDDLTQIISKAKEEGKIPDGKSVIFCNTPSYVGTHITGYANQLSSFVKFFSTATPRKKNVVNLVAGWMEPSDMRELKRIAALMEARIILFPDMSGVLDTPMTGKFQMYPSGGTTMQDIVATGDSKFTIGLGAYCTEDPCVKLENKCKVKFEVIEIPIGLKATDRFIVSLSRHANVPVPDAITEERGRLIDLITDNSKYFYGRRVALFGDPDTLIPLTEFLLTLDMRPVYIVTGTPGKHFDESMTALLSERVPEAKFQSGERADMFLLHQWIKQEPVDLLIGNTYGKYIARDENIPLLRLGFPVIDRPGNNYFPFVGYVGATNIAHRILEKFLDHKDANCPEEKVELQM
jgi:nitrogenase molybdenum-iron protein beta chain